MREICNYCSNKTPEECQNCDKSWYDRFIPDEKVKKFFRIGYSGVRGINGRTWNFDTTNKELKSTHFVLIKNKYFCPYCGNLMYAIQDEETLAVTGHCCICEGAMAELEYEEKKKELEKEFEEKVYNLKKEYKEKLTFCSDKLLDIKQAEERKSFNLFKSEHTHFCGINHIEKLI